MLKSVRFLITALAAAACLSTAAHAAGRITSKACTVSFQNTGVEGITDEGKGLYSDGVDGTRCTLESQGDLLFTLNYNRSKTSRAALVYLNRPVNNSVDRGLWVVTGMFHLHLADVGTVPVGGSLVHRASFHIPYGGVNHKLHFGWDAGDGTTIAVISHPTASTYTIAPIDPSAISRLWTGGGFGDPTVYSALGDYSVPFTMTVTLK